MRLREFAISDRGDVRFEEGGFPILNPFPFRFFLVGLLSCSPGLSRLGVLMRFLYSFRLWVLPWGCPVLSDTR